MLLKNQAERANLRKSRQHEEDNERRRHFAPQVIFARITKLVTITFTIDRGSSNFHPNAISWTWRKHGNVPRIHTYTTRKTRLLDSNQNRHRINELSPANKKKP